MSSQLLRVDLYPRGHSPRFIARVAELPGCIATAPSMSPLQSAISTAIAAHLSGHGPVRLIWETPVEHWLTSMTRREAIRVIAEIDGAPSVLLTSRLPGPARVGRSRLPQPTRGLPEVHREGLPVRVALPANEIALADQISSWAAGREAQHAVWRTLGMTRPMTSSSSACRAPATPNYKMENLHAAV